MASFALTTDKLNTTDEEFAPEHDFQVGDVFHTVAGITECVVLSIDEKGIHAGYADSGQPCGTWLNSRYLVFVR
jgi:hypothetical protein